MRTLWLHGPSVDQARAKWIGDPDDAADRAEEEATAGDEASVVGIRYADHLLQRLALRRISPDLVEAVYREATEHFRDVATGYLIAADRRIVAGRERDVIVVYDEESEGVVLITFHPCGRVRKLGGVLEGGGFHDELPGPV